MQVAKRLANIHPDKLMGTLQSHIDSGHEHAALQAIPDLQLRHPDFHNELEQIKAKLSDKLLDDVKVLNPQSAEVFRCVNCGGGLARQCPDTIHVICHYCGCDAEHPANDRELQRWNKALDLEANFTIGDFFTYQGVKWQAVGVQLFSGKVREYDSEDGWETNYARYTNWWMLNENREIGWLVDDGSRRYWAQKYIPQKPAVPDSKDRGFEHGEWVLEFAAGEFTYKPVVAEKHNSAEDKKSRRLPVDGTDTGASKQRYYTSVESQIDETGKVSEIEFVKSRMIPHTEMLAGLENKAALSDRSLWKNTMRILCVALPLLAASAFSLNRGGEKTTETVALAKNDTDVQMQQFKIEKSGQLIELTGSANGLQNNSWFGVDIGLVNSDDEDVYSKYLEFWRESGRDSDGPWSEASLRATWYVRVDDPDTYRIVVSADPQSSNATADFRMHMEPNKVSTTPFLFAGAFSLFLIFMSRSKMTSVSAAAASIALKLNQRYSSAKKNEKNAA